MHRPSLSIMCVPDAKYTNKITQSKFVFTFRNKDEDNSGDSVEPRIQPNAAYSVQIQIKRKSTLVKSCAYPFAHLYQHTILLTYHCQNSILQLPNNAALSTISQLPIIYRNFCKKKVHTFALIGGKQNMDSYIKKKLRNFPSKSTLVKKKNPEKCKK